MDFLSKKLNKWGMKASGMSDEDVKAMEEQQKMMEEAYKKGGAAGAQEAYFKEMNKMMEKAAGGNDVHPGSIADELAKLAKLKEQGVVTEAEFQQMKQELIKKMS